MHPHLSPNSKITLMTAQHSPSGLFRGVILMAPPFDVDAADYMTPEYEVLGRCISFFWPSMEVLGGWFFLSISSWLAFPKKKTFAVAWWYKLDDVFDSLSL